MANQVSYSELKERVARKLRILADTEQVSAEDGELIENALLGVEAALDTLGIASFDLATGLSEPMVDPVASMACAYLVDEFQIPEPRRSQLKTEGMLGLPGRSMAERQLRALMDAPTSKLATTTDVFHN